MKRNNKKGFTIVELVIVIAVIAILSAVMIPTFSGITAKANASAAQQEARNKFTEFYAEDLYDGVIDGKDATATTDQTVENYENGEGYNVDASNKATYTVKGADNKYYTFDGTDFTVSDSAPSLN